MIEDRGTGRTTRQLLAAPDDFYFVVASAHEAGYVKGLVQKHCPQKRPRIITIHSVMQVRGSTLPVVVDHHAYESLPPYERDMLYAHNERFAY